MSSLVITGRTSVGSGLLFLSELYQLGALELSSRSLPQSELSPGNPEGGSAPSYSH